MLSNKDPRHVKFEDDIEPSEEATTHGIYRTVESLLNAFHQAADQGDFDTYFNCFAEDGQFLGTDASEHWTVKEFRKYARPHFHLGRSAWTYTPFHDSRKIHYVRRPEVGIVFASFDEILRSPSFNCVCRGTGSAIFNQESQSWQIYSYHLSFPTPNGIAREVCVLLGNADRRLPIIQPKKEKTHSLSSSDTIDPSEAERMLLAELEEEDKNALKGSPKQKHKKPKQKKK